MNVTAAQPKTASLSTADAYAIGLESYVYFYSLLSMELTRRQSVNLDAGIRPGFGPANHISHLRAYPEADFKLVVRPNFDTLYSIAWFDLTSEPVVLSVPDSQNRYYMMPMLDMFSDVFACPGSRTSGTSEQHFAVVGPGWAGKLPAGVERIDAPTKYVWLIGRTKTDGPDDYAAVHKFQDGLKLTPLSQWGKGATPAVPKVKVDSSVDMTTATLDQVNNLSAGDYFKMAAELLKEHSAHISDWSIISRMKRIGLVPGQSFDFSALSADNQKAVSQGAADGLKMMLANLPHLGRRVNGWNMNTDTMGVYGNFYLKRAIVAMAGLGANQPEDAVYPLNIFDADGQPLNGANNYVMHFKKEELPPVDGFWSVTMYDKDGFQAANVLNRFAVSSWMPFKYNADGSLDLYLQNKTPGADKESNWLPAPLCELGVTMRLYAPKTDVLTGVWNPPVISKAK